MKPTRTKNFSEPALSAKLIFAIVCFIMVADCGQSIANHHSKNSESNAFSRLPISGFPEIHATLNQLLKPAVNPGANEPLPLPTDNMCHSLLAMRQAGLLFDPSFRTDSLTLTRTFHGFLAEDIPMINREDEYQADHIPITIEFDDQFRINRVSFSLNRDDRMEILGRSDLFGSMNEKHQLIRILEVFITAFLLKQKDCLDLILHEHSLIVEPSEDTDSKEPDSNMGRAARIIKKDDHAGAFKQITRSEYLENYLLKTPAYSLLNKVVIETSVRRSIRETTFYGINIRIAGKNGEGLQYLFMMLELVDNQPHIGILTRQNKEFGSGGVFSPDDFGF